VFLPPTVDVRLEMRVICWQSSVVLMGETIQALIAVAYFLVGLVMGGSEPIMRQAKGGRDQHYSAMPLTM
jgi:hypothetical protein